MYADHWKKVALINKVREMKWREIKEENVKQRNRKIYNKNTREETPGGDAKKLATSN